MGRSLSALDPVASAGVQDCLTYKFDAILVPSQDQQDRAPYKVLQKLGEGSYGNVVKAQHTVTNKVHAVKRVRTTVQMKEQDLREPLLWKDLVHDCVCRYYRHWVDPVDDDGETTICKLVSVCASTISQ